MYPGAQAKIRRQAAGSLISCARAASAGSDRYALHREQRPLCRILRRRVRGALLHLHQLVSDAGKPRLGPMSSAVFRRVTNRVRGRLIAGGKRFRTNGSAKVQLKSRAAGFEEIANFLSNLRSNDS